MEERGGEKKREENLRAERKRVEKIRGLVEHTSG